MSVFSQKIGRLRYFLLTAAYVFLRLPPVAWLDRMTFPNLANLFKRGSVNKVVARKIAEP